MIKEKLLVLAKAAPVVSKKYKELICIAGITKDGAWRRIYPIPWECFWRNSKTYFKKKSWIEYSLRETESSDHRPESRKINTSSISSLHEENYKTIKKILDKNLTTLEELKEKGHREVSLGVIKPIITDFIEEKSNTFGKLKERGKQLTIFGKSIIRIDPAEKRFSYVFKCGNPKCKGHKMMCEDWELAELYRHCRDYRKIGKYKDDKEVFEKIKLKMLDFMIKKSEIYFIVGTHYRFNTFIIVGIIYPKKGDL